MVVHSFGSGHRRILVFAATAFFIASAYLCVTRLFNMSFTRESYSQHDKIANTIGNEDPSINMPPPGAEPGTEPPKPDQQPPPPPQEGDKKEGEEDDIKLIHADLPMSYGNYKRPGYDDIKLLDSLPLSVVPTYQNDRRLIVIGDIHGMDVPLEELLKKCHYDETKDHVVALGDMISKGPDSPAVISRLMSLNASAVRGNHEDRVLLARAAFDAQHGVSSDLESTDFEEHRGELEELVLARSLSQDQLDWLATLPTILTADPLPLTFVHAGLVPGVALRDQDPWAVMNMRTIMYPREELREKEKEEPRRRKNKKRDNRNDIAEGRKKRFEGDGSVAAGFEEAVGGAYEDDGSITPDLIASVQPPGEDEDVDTSQISFDRAILVPIDNHNGEKWADVWDRYQKRLRRAERRTVVYGHDAKTGYKEGEFSFGIDSDCARGGALTALIISPTEDGGFRHLTQQVPCTKP